LARMALATAAGQQMDVQNLPGEENYWRIVAAKSTPFYGAALELGALLGSADPQVVSQLYRLGVMIGEMIQLEDDLTDALQTPANPDWGQGRNNLLILYALTADYPERSEFVTLLPHVDDPRCLARAQVILVSCGAVSYGVYHLIQRYQAARRLLEETRLTNPEPLSEMLTRYGESLASYLKVSGSNVEPEL
ncbi:MAG: polyprenyl synthetase family protein, partial [Chloroflexota bacterium]